VTFYAGSRIYLAVNFVLTHVIATVRQIAIRRIGKLVSRFNLFFVGMAVGAE